MKEYSRASNRYNGIKKRSFAYYINYYLIFELMQDINKNEFD